MLTILERFERGGRAVDGDHDDQSAGYENEDEHGEGEQGMARLLNSSQGDHDDDDDEEEEEEEEYQTLLQNMQGIDLGQSHSYPPIPFFSPFFVPLSSPFLSSPSEPD
jgi:hypothetical protein